MTDNGRWQFWIDVGGTFTDCIGLKPDGQLIQHKLLSTSQYKAKICSIVNERKIILDIGHERDGFFEGYSLYKDSPFSLNDDSTQPLQFTSHQVVESYSCQNAIVLKECLSSDLNEGDFIYLLSHQPAAVTGIRYLMGKKMSEDIGKVDVRLGTTVGINALLEHKYEKIAFVVTQGFKDLLLIGDQTRPELFNLEARRPGPLYEKVIEAEERLSSVGGVIRPLNMEKMEIDLRAVRGQGIKSIAVCLMHSYLNRRHEDQIADLARKIGFSNIILSAEVCPFQKYLHRGYTTVLEGCVGPVFILSIN